MYKETIVKTTRLDRWLFFKKFFQNPREIGSLVPSSASLARQMLAPVRWDEATSIVELGAGTGVFTQAIHESRRPECSVAVFEKDDELRGKLQKQFHGLHMFKNAMELKKNIDRLGLSEVDYIISGLPFANFSVADRCEIIGQIKQTLRKDGVFVTFQYSLQMKKMLQNEFGRVNISLVPWNVPSAFVYECRP
ncbi:class I SAM-dependent methyltransferase [Paenibacillus piri]|uniref:Phospholipid methyltransferase n=1 Tax=Paenibacillus piri TaxID=2547395 RepID=A0A4R5KPC9_9BACL|nr:methyltransferase [Paenibacillus piri]TDF97563.1 phospholipid methyltransferase [Paenibacillus piri]